MHSAGLHRVTRGLLITGLCALGTVLAARGWWASQGPTQAAVIRVDRWAADYRGQKWVMATGAMAYDEAVVRAVPDSYGRTRGNYYALVPMRPVNPMMRDALRVVAVIGPGAQSEMKRLVSDRRRSGPVVVNGFVEGGWDRGQPFAKLRSASNVAYVRCGVLPEKSSAKLAVAAGLGVLTLIFATGVVRGVVAMRNGRDGPKAPSGVPGLPPSIAIREAARAGSRPFF